MVLPAILTFDIRIDLARNLVKEATDYGKGYRGY
jgi:hypothetical protein